MKVKKDKNIKRTPLLDLYIQRIIAEQMNQVDEQFSNKQLMELLKNKESETKNLN